MCCFYPTKQWCQKQVVFVNGKEGTLVLGSPTGPWPWPPPNLARSKVVGNMRFLRKKSEKMAVWADLRHGFHVFGCCESGVDSDAFISSSQYMARCMSFNPSCHLLTTYHPITILLPISNPRAAARIVAHPHSTWGSESDVSDFTKTIKTSKKTAIICFWSRSVKHSPPICPFYE